MKSTRLKAGVLTLHIEIKFHSLAVIAGHHHEEAKLC